MSEFITVARPYAKAAFDFAVEHQSVERWQDMLAFAAEVTKTNKWQSFSLARLRQKRSPSRLSQFVVSNWTKTVRT
ncbi:hypothetical protein MUTS15_72730 [Escherichia coli]|nr:hypothetical protein MUTS15_72730 [Escherichia coli]